MIRNVKFIFISLIFLAEIIPLGYNSLGIIVPKLNAACINSPTGNTSPSRTVTIQNNCNFEVRWALKGTYIQDSGVMQICLGNASKFGDKCAFGNGYCGDTSLIPNSNPEKYEDRKCYFKYPVLQSSSDQKPDYILDPNAWRKYRIDLIDMHDKEGKAVSQYTLNIAAQTECTNNPDGKISCGTGYCTNIFSNKTTAKGDPIPDGLPRNGSIPSGACSPTDGPGGAVTQAEITFNDGQNDFYDVSIINGANVPISIKPEKDYPLQNERQAEFWCTAPGEQNPTKNPISGGKLNGCSWAFTPPTLQDPLWIKAPSDFSFIFKIVKPSGQSRCSTDTDCNQPEVCGIRGGDNEDYVQYDIRSPAGTKPGYCGKLVAINTLATIAPLIYKGEHAVTLADILKVKELVNYTNTEKFTVAQLFMCETTQIKDNHDKFLYNALDSCYNYKFNDVDINDDDSVKNPLKPYNKYGADACCGCIDWPDVPTDKDKLCSFNGDTTKSRPAINHPNQKWLDIVKPVLSWLIDACPDAYEYQYGDKHGTVQCNSQINPIDKGNKVNYVITFCPGGKDISLSGGSQPVNPVDCKGSWTDWSQCDQPCGPGHQTRTFHITTPASNDGKPCDPPKDETETKACNIQPCTTPVNCVGSWTDWSQCDKPCGGGKQTRNFHITTPASNGGNPCDPPTDKSETQSCNTQPCPPTPTAVTVYPPRMSDAKDCSLIKPAFKGLYWFENPVIARDRDNVVGNWVINFKRCQKDLSKYKFVDQTGNVVAYDGAEGITATLSLNSGWSCKINSDGKSLSCEKK